MAYTPISPFRRMLAHAELQHSAQLNARLPDDAARQMINKWDALNELTVARKAFGLSDRDLTVLQALISFHPETEIRGAAIVYPSNASLCARLHGMACSTMRRHLAALVSAGIVIRRDSPNGKRYSRRKDDDKIAFGFDLAPLLTRFDEFAAAAEAQRREAEALAELRETVSLMKRDMIALLSVGQITAPHHGLWDQAEEFLTDTARILRRKPAIDALQNLHETMADLLAQIKSLVISEEMSTSDRQNEQHYQNSNKDLYESDPMLVEETTSQKTPEAQPSADIALEQILTSCSEATAFTPTPIKSWGEFTGLMTKLRPMMGISASTWRKAVEAMGLEQASVTIAAILQRMGDIRSPGAYLTRLTQKALTGSFSAAPMVHALSRQAA